MPSTDEYDGQKLFTKRNAKRVATPLFAVLILVEATDVIFAVDSVPAVLAVSHEQFIVFASNAFAILGLRALYFLLADMHSRFAYLQEGLAIILAFVGVKMLISEWYHIPTWLSLMVIAIVLAASIGFSLKATRNEEQNEIAGQAFSEESPAPDVSSDPVRRHSLTRPWGSRTTTSNGCVRRCRSSTRSSSTWR